MGFAKCRCASHAITLGTYTCASSAREVTIRTVECRPAACTLAKRRTAKEEQKKTAPKSQKHKSFATMFCCMGSVAFSVGIPYEESPCK
jgi:hypothetical protein